MTPTSRDIETLATAIGEEVYIDVAKWHLYLNDAKLHTSLAEHFASMLTEGKVDEDAATAVLETISVPIGGGKQQLKLLELLPMQSVMNLLDVLEKYADEWR
ncbi:MAG: DUF3181 family protein [Cyanobacteria bacterium P01_F01_bin.33]